MSLTVKKFGDEHPNTAIVLNNLGELARFPNRLDDAAKLHERALSKRKRTLGRSLATAFSLHNLAVVLTLQGKPKEAEPLLQEAVAQAESLQKGRPETAQLRATLAEFYRRQGRVDDARVLFEATLPILERSFGRNHPVISTVLNNLALTYQALGRPSDAKPLLMRSRRIVEKSFGDKSPDLVAVLFNIGSLYVSQNQCEEAVIEFKKCLEILKHVGGERCPETALVLNGFGEAQRRLGRYNEAERLFKQAITLHEKSSDTQKVELGTSLNNLALTYVGQGRYAEAEPIFVRAIQAFEEGTGTEVERRLVVTLESYARLLRDHLWRAAEADEFEFQAKKLRSMMAK